MPQVADIFRLHGAAYLARFGQAVLPSHRRALVDLRDCRTAVLGGRLYVCDHCGREHFVYHSCRNRACPKCHARDTEAWLAHRRQELLPVPYFHVVFTVPQTLRDLLRRHQTALYPVLMRAAAKALIQLAADPHYVGGLIGVMAVLHTWSTTLVYHPHVHCLVPATGVQTDPDGRQHWGSARKNFLVPVKALSKLFRGLFLHLAHKALGGLSLPASASRQPWVVYCKPTMRHTDKVLSYLGRYVHRVAITNHRILAVDDRQVTFRYTDRRSRQTRTMTLGAHEFIRRFLQHVLPKGFHKVRYYGLWAPANRTLLRRVQLALGPAEPSQLAEPSGAGAEAPSARRALEGSPCPFCRSGALVYLRPLPPQPRPPP